MVHDGHAWIETSKSWAKIFKFKCYACKILQKKKIMFGASSMIWMDITCYFHM